MISEYEVRNSYQGNVFVGEIYNAPLADLRGSARNAPCPGGPNSFIFMQFFGK